MTSRERVIKAFKRIERPDRVPVFFRVTPHLEKVFEEKTGKPFSELDEYFNLDARLFNFWDDMKSTADMKVFHPRHKELNLRINAWGIGFESGSFYHFDKLHHPLQNAASLKDIENFPFPELPGAEVIGALKQKMDAVRERGIATIADIAMVGGSVFWPAYKLRGMEELLTDMYDEQEMLECLLDKVTDISCKLAAEAAKTGADIIFMADDFGTQQDLMMSEKQWRYWFKPRLARVIAVIKQTNPEAIVAFHSDGNIMKIVPDLIEIGVDALNPIQPECMDINEVQKNFGGSLAFWGGVGTQTTMPFGTCEDVKNTVKKVIEVLGKDGGLLIAPTHVLEPEVPWENITAFMEAVMEYGTYK